MSGAPSSTYLKASNAAYISSVFLKHLFERPESNNVEELYLSLNDSEPVPQDFVIGIICSLFDICFIENEFSLAIFPIFFLA